MKQIKSLIGIFVVVAAFYLAFKLMPPYYNQIQFQEAVEQEARNASYNMRSEDDLRNVIMKKARENDIPVTPEMVKVQKMGNNDVSVNVDYTVTEMAHMVRHAEPKIIVVDHERITGLDADADAVVDAIAVYRVVDGLIRAVWFF